MTAKHLTWIVNVSLVALLASVLTLAWHRWRDTEPKHGGMPDKHGGMPDAIAEPTPEDGVELMLELAQITKDDVLYDLGCGDGRFLTTAAKKYGCKAHGVDIEPAAIAGTLLSIKKHGVESLVTVQEQDLFTLDLRPASVVTFYLLPHINAKLIPQLEQMKPGCRIVSYMFEIPGIKPTKVVQLPDRDYAKRFVYLWITPLEREPEKASAD